MSATKTPKTSRPTVIQLTTQLTRQKIKDESSGKAPSPYQLVDTRLLRILLGCYEDLEQVMNMIIDTTDINILMDALPERSHHKIRTK